MIRYLVPVFFVCTVVTLNAAEILNAPASVTVAGKEVELSATRAEKQQQAAIQTERARKMNKQLSHIATSESFKITVTEINRLNGEVARSDAMVEDEFLAEMDQLSAKYDEDIAALRQATQKNQDTSAESDAGRLLSRERIAALDRKKNEELAALEQRLIPEQKKRASGLRRKIDQLAGREITVGAENVLILLGDYNPQQQFFPVTLKISLPLPGLESTGSKTTLITGVIPLPGSKSVEFEKLYSQGLLRPEVTVNAGSYHIIRAALANDAENHMLDYVNNEFTTAAERTRRSIEQEQRKMVGSLANVPGGCFTTGDKKSCVDDFRIGMHEVTQWQYQRVMGSNPSRFNQCGDDCPVEQVSWYDAQEFIRRLNSQTGGNYRLPTEAEWEYACHKGDSKNQLYCGSNNVNDVAWFDGNSSNSTHKVATRRANGLGLFDMTGNVWEWVDDWYYTSYPADSRNREGASSGTAKVLRGGSWRDYITFVRASYRRSSSPDYRDYNIGFRLAAPAAAR